MLNWTPATDITLKLGDRLMRKQDFRVFDFVSYLTEDREFTALLYERELGRMPVADLSQYLYFQKTEKVFSYRQV
jgi:hypothetical protein